MHRWMVATVGLDEIRIGDRELWPIDRERSDGMPASSMPATGRLSDLIRQLLLNPLLRIWRKSSVGCLVSVFRKLARSGMNVMKLFLVALAPATNQKVQAFLDPHHQWHRLVH
jgi:hypothetical protein